MSDTATARSERVYRGEIISEGAPASAWDSESEEIVLYPTWRSQLFPLLGFLVLCGLTPVLSEYVPGLVLKGKLFAIGDTLYVLHLPVFSLLPAALLGKILLHIYDSRYIIDDSGVEAQVGLVSLSLRQPRLRYEDIRGVEPKQTLFERILGIGDLLVGSAMTFDVEIVMQGIARPRAVQQYLNRRRDQAVRQHRRREQEARPYTAGD